MLSKEEDVGPGRQGNATGTQGTTGECATEGWECFDAPAIGVSLALKAMPAAHAGTGGLRNAQGIHAWKGAVQGLGVLHEASGWLQTACVMVLRGAFVLAYSGPAPCCMQPERSRRWRGAWYAPAALVLSLH